MADKVTGRKNNVKRMTALIMVAVITITMMPIRGYGEPIESDSKREEIVTGHPREVPETERVNEEDAVKEVNH